jgi:hypothetical protein
LKVRVVTEAGDKRVFISALDWPGWSRGARSREDAIAALIEYGPRYKKSLGPAAAELTVPTSVDALDIAESASGNKNVDYGVPQTVMAADREAINDAELKQHIKRLQGAWKAFEEAAAAARGKSLASGPRGGGRSVAQIVEHVHGADREAYIPAIGAKAPTANATRDEVEAAFIDALHAKVRGELPERGPRGGERWPARYAIRRSAWHALDHAWEIEDRSS